MRVLLATDGSEASKDAQWLLARIPFTSPLELTIAYVNVIPSLTHLKREFPSHVAGILEQYQSDGEALLAEEVSRFEGIRGTVEGCLKEGHPSETLIDLAEEKNAELIIVGARGQSATQQFLMGSTSAAIAKHADCSVLVTRPSEKVKASHRTFRIVVAVDGSDVSQNGVEMLAGIPWGENVDILVVSILQNESHLGTWDTELRRAIDGKEKAARERIVQSAVAQLRKATSRVAGEVVRANSVTEELLDTIERVDADLVVLGHRGLSRIKRFFIGSTCERILRHAKCSVWVHKDSE
ncbi:universal stress protein [Thalassoglobus polymorphus]|uniref:Universal stress protein n=1 Tax=Thalassoglobus polymorphus TaxID=2527994 RepID=A0A517QJN4_9PLAN|nr:universal stress protein [Thalassoglobus polymorphus]QDT31848.1 Putative universal stress protein [Thalassoglobus polymorphus]